MTTDQADNSTVVPTTRAERLVDFLRRRARITIPLLVIGALGMGVFASKIEIDNSLQVWFVDGDPALKAYERYQDTFGNDETVIVAVVDPTGIYRPTTLERIRTASKLLQENTRVRRVSSVAVGLHVSGEDGFVRVEKLLGDGEITDEEAAAVRKRIAMNPAFKGTIVPNSDSENVTLILVTPKSSDDFEHERGPLIDDIRAIADKTIASRSEGIEVHLGGIGVVYDGLNRASVRDSSIFTTLSYLIIFFGMWLLFRRWIWVLTGAAVVTLANVATLGLAGAAGRDMNMVSAVLPTLIMTIGILDMIHLIDAFEQSRLERRDLPRRRVLLASLSVVIIPCIFNTVTDAVGFLALSSARMSAVRDLGWLAAAGLGFLLLSVLIIAVPAIARFGGRGRRADKRNPEKGWIRAVVLRCYAVARDRRPLVYATTVALLAISVFGISRVVVDTYSIGFLADDDPVRKDHQAIEETFGPYIPLEFTVSAPPPPEDESVRYAGVKDPMLLRRIESMERAFETRSDIARATGLPEIVARVNQIWNDEKPGSYAIPNSAGIVAEELLNYGFEPDGRDHLDDLVTPSWQTTHVSARTGLPSARRLAKTVAGLNTIAKREIGDAGTTEPAGYLPLYVRIISHVTDAQVRSFAIAFVLITLILMVLLRSVRLGLIAMIPNLLPPAMTLGFMGLVGIRLDVATVLIAAIAIGISVNDTSHIMFRFRSEMKKTSNAEEAVRHMMLHVGRAVVASSVVLVAGFAVLLMASVKSVAYFGLLTSATIVSALVADLIVTPALLMSVGSRSRPRN